MTAVSVAVAAEAASSSARTTEDHCQQLRRDDDVDGGDGGDAAVAGDDAEDFHRTAGSCRWPWRGPGDDAAGARQAAARGSTSLSWPSRDSRGYDIPRTSRACCRYLLASHSLPFNLKLRDRLVYFTIVF